MIAKIAFTLLTVLFLAMAAVQLDDPDSWRWIAMFLLFAVSAALAAFCKPNVWITALAIVVCLGMLVPVVPGFLQFLTNKDGIGISNTMSNEFPYVEEFREFGGLIISLVGLVSVLVFSLRLRRDNQSG